MTTETQVAPVSMPAPAPAGPPPTKSVEEGHAYFQGAIVPLAQANVSIATHAFNYGTGCFEGIRGYWNAAHNELYLLKLPEHYMRLIRSGKILKIDAGLDVPQLVEITRAVLRRDDYRQDVYVRPLLYKASKVIKVCLSGLEDQFAMFAVPMGNYMSTDGLRVTVSGWRRNDDNAIPSRGKVTGGYVNAALAVDDAQQAGYDEAIMLTADGHVSEGSAANFFLIADGALITPQVSNDILVGITRGAVHEMARYLGIPIVERAIDRSELYQADEAFMCGTGVQIAPVVEVDGRKVGDGKLGPLTRALQETYFQAVRGEVAAFRHWLTPLYEGA